MTNAELRKISHILITHHYDGHHVIRKNDRFWADLSTDLIIEVVMRNFRTTDGLTRGSGMNESARLVFLLWTPACRGDPGGFGHCQLFVFFFILCSCDEANLLPKERNSLCLWIAICVFNTLCRRITLLEIMNFMLLEGFGQLIWGGYGHCQNIPQVSDSSLNSVQFLPEFFVKMHLTDWKSINRPIIVQDTFKWITQNEQYSHWNI